MSPLSVASSADALIDSRGVQIPITIEVPDEAGATPVPLVVLVHGHGGSKEENGGFTELAAMLAANGIASVRMDFPGCGESTEPFTQNNVTNMLQDISASLRFTLAEFNVDRDRIGILGYSMGGRLAMLAADPQYAAMVLWAPVADNGPRPMFPYFGGRDDYYDMRSLAVENDFVVVRTEWGAEHHLGKQWFYDMEQTAPLYTISSYEGPLLILHGDEDTAVLPSNGEAALAAATASKDARLDIVQDADHGFGFFDDDLESREYLLTQTVAFFREQLLD